MNATIATQVTEALEAAGHRRAVRDAGFFAVGNGNGGVIVIADLGEHAEGHRDSDGYRAAQAREVEGYWRSLEAAGWAAQVSVRGGGTGLVVTGRARVSR